MANVFESKEPMPPKGVSEDVCRVAQVPAEVHAFNLTPAVVPNSYMDVKSAVRPRRGHGY